MTRWKTMFESRKEGDILVLNSPDNYENLSKKMYRGLEWSSKFHYNYLIKTDDDCFLRLDTILDELFHMKPVPYYWRGLVYRFHFIFISNFFFS